MAISNFNKASGAIAFALGCGLNAMFSKAAAPEEGLMVTVGAILVSAALNLVLESEAESDTKTYGDGLGCRSIENERALDEELKFYNVCHLALSSGVTAGFVLGLSI